MKVTTIGRGMIGGTLARLWTSAGHEVTQLGRVGGDAADAGVVLLAVPNQAVPAALAGVTGLRGKVIIDATNRLGAEAPPTGYPSIAEYVKASTGGPTAKALIITWGGWLDQAAVGRPRAGQIFAADERAGGGLEQPGRDMGME